MFLIGVPPVPAQFDGAVLLGIGVILTALLAIAVALQVVTTPPSDHGTTQTGAPRHLGPVA
jgi:hypothetical protein